MNTALEQFTELERLSAAATLLRNALRYVEDRKLGEPIQTQLFYYNIFPPTPQLRAREILEDVAYRVQDEYEGKKRTAGPGNYNADVLHGIDNNPGR